ncbi:MAG TPA: zf-HC2 domain-containing protein [Kiritimatiellia bacterium]|nr:zf-HC2 domain-containing protein [Kiritimatiellia bacterium]HMP32707.1 zf-HC2 domain-containing protein [Kiritimatiellia bacterium]
MKKSELELISRGLDGDLSPDERVRLEALRTREPEARTVERQWTVLGDTLRHDQVAAPDATVAWQDIQRAIRQQAGDAGSASTGGWMVRFRWAAGLAVLVVGTVLGLSAWRVLDGRTPVWVMTDPVESPANRVEWVVAEIPGATTMIYTDTETDMTVIWMDVAQNVDPRDS